MAVPEVKVPPRLATMRIFGLTLAAAVALSPVHRPLSVVELWAGVGAVANAAASQGLPSKAMDIERVPGMTDGNGPESENILSRAGFMNSLKAVLAIQPGGLLWMAPVCSSWVFLNSCNCQRSKEHPEGSTGYKPVQEGNRMASMAAFLFAVAILTGVHPVVEQPAGSIMFRFQPLKKVIDAFKATHTTCARCAFTPDVEYGARLLKRYKFLGESWVSTLHTKCTCAGRQHRSMVTVGAQGNQKTVTGKADVLKESQAYPANMGKWVVDQYLQKDAVPCPLSSVHWKTPELKKRPVSSSWKAPQPYDVPPAKKIRVSASGADFWKRPSLH